MTVVLLDTNFLMVPAVLKVDIFSEISALSGSRKLYVVEKSVAELESLQGKGKPRDRRAARLALQIVRQKMSSGGIEIIPSGGKEFATADDAIIDFILANGREGIVVATQDKLLKERVRAAGASLLVLRQKKYVKMVD